MVDTVAGANNIFRKVYQIHIACMQHQAYGSFVMLGIGNAVNRFLPSPLVVSSLQNISTNAKEVNRFYDSVRSDVISKSIEVSI